jgi:uncharacterized protein (TIGR02300 family)
MSKPELGTKRLCGNCGAKFYDLHHDPIVCPKCATVFVLLTPAPAAPRRPAHRWQGPVALAAVTEAAVVPLAEAEDPEAVVAEEEARSSEALDDAEVLAEESDADEDPAALIGDRDNGEEGWVTCDFAARRGAHTEDHRAACHAAGVEGGRGIDGQSMNGLFWLCYRKSGQVSVAIIETPSLIGRRGTESE